MTSNKPNKPSGGSHERPPPPRAACAARLHSDGGYFNLGRNLEQRRHLSDHLTTDNGAGAVGAGDEVTEPSTRCFMCSDAAVKTLHLEQDGNPVAMKLCEACYIDMIGKTKSQGSTRGRGQRK